MSEPTKANGLAGLAALKEMNWPTLILVLVTGAGNWFNTNQNSQARSYEIEKAISQVNELHHSLSEWEGRQRQGTEGIAQALKNQTAILENQNKAMQSQTEILKAVRQFQQQFKNPEFHGP